MPARKKAFSNSDEGEMIQSIVHFGDKVAREVMTPRTQIVAIDMTSSVEKLLQLILAKRHTRIPAFEMTSTTSKVLFTSGICFASGNEARKRRIYVRW